MVTVSLLALHEERTRHDGGACFAPHSECQGPGGLRPRTVTPNSCSAPARRRPARGEPGGSRSARSGPGMGRPGETQLVPGRSEPAREEGPPPAALTRWHSDRWREPRRRRSPGARSLPLGPAPAPRPLPFSSHTAPPGLPRAGAPKGSLTPPPLAGLCFRAGEEGGGARMSSGPGRCRWPGPGRGEEPSPSGTRYKLEGRGRGRGARGRMRAGVGGGGTGGSSGRRKALWSRGMRRRGGGSGGDRSRPREGLASWSFTRSALRLHTGKADLDTRVRREQEGPGPDAPGHQGPN